MTTGASDIIEWIVSAGLAGRSQGELLQGTCERLEAAGVPILRAHVSQNTLHPLYKGVGFSWTRGGAASEENYPRSNELLQRWLQSPFHYMIENLEPVLRVRLVDSNEPSRFPVLDEFREMGATDYYARAVGYGEAEFESLDAGGPVRGIVSSWVTDAPEGFNDGHIATLETMLPALALALKSVSSDRIADDLFAVYLGRDAGRRVQSGAIQRGSLDTIRAVIWYFDLQGFTQLAETNSGDDLITLLNDYFGAVVGIVEGHGGDVLKFMGDGLLAIFRFEDDDMACCSALAAADELVARLAGLNGERAARGEPVADFNLALHLGDVLYGNIGGEDRLDFTVVGPAVNEAARIEALCRSLERHVVISSAFADSVQTGRERVISLGRYMLRGVRKPQELFTLVAAEDLV